MQTSGFSMETRSARKKMRLEHGRMLVSEDRLSNLPEPLLDEIVSRLPSKSIAWMSTLSRKWAYLIESFLGLFFDEQEFEYRSDRQNDRRLYLFISKYLFRPTPIMFQKIKFGTSHLRRDRMYPDLKQFLNLVLSAEIRELDLKLRHSSQFHQTDCYCYLVPTVVFSHGVYLTALELEGCRFPDLDAVNVPFLKTISMTYVHISDSSLFKFVAASPSLESLTLQSCDGSRLFRIVNPSLCRVAVINCREMEAFYIDCPCLQYLECKGRQAYDHRSNLKVSDFCTSCAAIREVNFAHLNLGAELLDRIFSNAPHVRRLTMASCTVERNLKVLPRELKHLELIDTEFSQLLSLSTVESFLYRISSHSFLGYPNGYLKHYYSLVNFVQLKSLTLEGSLPPSDKDLQLNLFWCPRLISLYLILRFNLDSLRIVSHTLKILSIKASIVGPLDCDIEAPNLESFNFEGPPVQFSRVIITSRELLVKLKFKEVFDPSLRISKWGHYVQMFNMARLVILNNQLYECVLSPMQGTIASPQSRGLMKVNASLWKMCYKDFLSEVLCMPFCPTSLSLNFMSLIYKNGSLPFSHDPSACFDLKFENNCQQGGAAQQGEDHDCVRDHLYEANIQIIKRPSQTLDMLKLLLSKARHLRKVTVQVSDEVAAKSGATIAPQINAMWKVSPSCEVILP